MARASSALAIRSSVRQTDLGRNDCYDLERAGFDDNDLIADQEVIVTAPPRFDCNHRLRQRKRSDAKAIARDSGADCQVHVYIILSDPRSIAFAEHSCPNPRALLLRQLRRRATVLLGPWGVFSGATLALGSRRITLHPVSLVLRRWILHPVFLILCRRILCPVPLILRRRILCPVPLVLRRRILCPVPLVLRRRILHPVPFLRRWVGHAVVGGTAFRLSHAIARLGVFAGRLCVLC
jgi:hypothetical protein